MEPRQAMKCAEQSPDLTPKERQKILAIALIRIAKSSMELSIMWSFSQMIASANGYSVPDYDPKFVLEINENPSAFVDYK